MNSIDINLEKIKRLSVVIGICVSIASIIIFPLNIGVGVALGCFVGVLNFFWLEQTVSGIFSGENSRKKTVYLMKYLFRFLLIAVLLCVIMLDRRMHVKSMIGVAIGFSVPPAAAFIGGIFINKKKA